MKTLCFNENRITLSEWRVCRRALYTSPLQCCWTLERVAGGSFATLVSPHLLLHLHLRRPSDSEPLVRLA